MQQARPSHGLLWNTEGDFRYNHVSCAFEAIFSKIGRPVDLRFYAKRLEESRVFEQFVAEVTNLEDLG